MIELQGIPPPRRRSRRGQPRVSLEVWVGRRWTRRSSGFILVLLESSNPSWGGAKRKDVYSKLGKYNFSPLNLRNVTNHPP